MRLKFQFLPLVLFSVFKLISASETANDNEDTSIKPNGSTFKEILAFQIANPDHTGMLTLCDFKMLKGLADHPETYAPILQSMNEHFDSIDSQSKWTDPFIWTLLINSSIINLSDSHLELFEKLINESIFLNHPMKRYIGNCPFSFNNVDFPQFYDVNILEIERGAFSKEVNRIAAQFKTETPCARLELLTLLYKYYQSIDIAHNRLLSYHYASIIQTAVVSFESTISALHLYCKYALEQLDELARTIYRQLEIDPESIRKALKQSSNYLCCFDYSNHNNAIKMFFRSKPHRAATFDYFKSFSKKACELYSQDILSELQRKIIEVFVDPQTDAELKFFLAGFTAFQYTGHIFYEIKIEFGISLIFTAVMRISDIDPVIFDDIFDKPSFEVVCEAREDIVSYVSDRPGRDLHLIQCAIVYSHLETVKLLYSITDAAVLTSEVHYENIILAIKKSDFYMIDWLLFNSENTNTFTPTKRLAFFVNSADYGQTRIFRRLLGDFCFRREDNEWKIATNKALRGACIGSFTEIIDILFKDPKCSFSSKTVLNALATSCNNPTNTLVLFLLKYLQTERPELLKDVVLVLARYGRLDLIAAVIIKEMQFEVDQELKNEIFAEIFQRASLINNLEEVAGFFETFPWEIDQEIKDQALLFAIRSNKLQLVMYLIEESRFSFPKNIRQLTLRTTDQIQIASYLIKNQKFHPSKAGLIEVMNKLVTSRKYSLLKVLVENINLSKDLVKSLVTSAAQNNRFKFLDFVLSKYEIDPSTMNQLLTEAIRSRRKLTIEYLVANNELEFDPELVEKASKLFACKWRIPLLTTK